MSVASFGGGGWNVVGLNQTARVVKIETNKGITGYGECRIEDINSMTELSKCYSLLLGMNPTQVDVVFNAVTAKLNPTADWKQITYASGAIAAIECACWDITGKVYNVPIWKLLGSKVNDRMRMYCDTPRKSDLSQRKTEIQTRINQGFTWFKTDLDGYLSSSDYTNSPDPNPYTESGGVAKRITESAQICAGTEMPILSGEDMFGFDELKKMVNAGAIDYFHPDPTTFGGIHQSRQAAMWAHERGVRTALHQSNSPIAMMMCAHIAAGIPDFLSCEHHYPEISWYDALVDGIPKPLMVNGYVQIPDGPGLGVTPNDATMSAHRGTTPLWQEVKPV